MKKLRPNSTVKVHTLASLEKMGKSLRRGQPCYITKEGVIFKLFNLAEFTRAMGMDGNCYHSILCGHEREGWQITKNTRGAIQFDPSQYDSEKIYE